MIDYESVAWDALEAGFRETEADRVAEEFGVVGEDLKKVLDEMKEIVDAEKAFVKDVMKDRIEERCREEYNYDDDTWDMVFDRVESEVVPGIKDRADWWKITEEEIEDIEDDVIYEAKQEVLTWDYE